MAIVGARIDNRLLHGVVATSWAPNSNATRVMVIDDNVANNPQKKQAMKLGRPSGMAVSIITKQKALDHFKEHKYDRQRVFIVSQTPEVFLDLINQGEEIKQIVLGGTLTFDNAIKVTKNAGHLLKFCNKKIPLARGQSGPLVRDLVPQPHAHGFTGMDGANLSKYKYPLTSRNAVTFMAKILSEITQKVTIVATAPLTNIALLTRGAS